MSKRRRHNSAESEYDDDDGDSDARNDELLSDVAEDSSISQESDGDDDDQPSDSETPSAKRAKLSQKQVQAKRHHKPSRQHGARQAEKQARVSKGVTTPNKEQKRVAELEKLLRAKQHELRKLAAATALGEKVHRRGSRPWVPEGALHINGPRVITAAFVLVICLIAVTLICHE